jgi:hypothetical protein
MAISFGSSIRRGWKARSSGQTADRLTAVVRIHQDSFVSRLITSARKLTPMGPRLDKDPSILAVLERLWLRLGPDVFVLADHWEPDLCAVGIASPRNPGVLAYISCYGEAPDRFGYELELPPPPGDDFPYIVAGSGSGLSFEELVGVVAGHLNRAEPGRCT